MNPRLRTLVGELVAEARLVLDWWRHELQDAWHAGLTRLMPRHADCAWIHIDESEAHVHWRQNGKDHEGTVVPAVGPTVQVVTQVAAALSGVRPGTRTRVQLALSKVLLRDIVLPQVTDGDLAAMIALQVGRVLPLQPGAMYIDWRVTKRLPEQRRIVVTIAATKRTEIDTLRDCITRTGLRLDEISASEGGKPAFVFSRLHVPLRAAGWTKPDRLLTVSLSVILVAWSTLVVSRLIYERQRITQIVANEHAESLPARKLKQQILARVVPMERVQELMLTPSATDLLGVLTRAIPTDTWVYSAEISGGAAGASPGVKLSGFTPVATMLVDHLAKNPSLQSVRLVKASGTAGGIGIDRFEISAQLTRPSKAAPAKEATR